jgi:hypothetical protein
MIDLVEKVTATVIRCAGRGGRCRRIIATAEANPGRGPESPILGLSNAGYAPEHGYVLSEDSVPADFSGSTSIPTCPDHDALILEKKPGQRPALPGAPAGDFVEGESVQMPNSLLQEPYRQFLRTNRVQEVAWLPTPATAVYRPE